MDERGKAVVSYAEHELIHNEVKEKLRALAERIERLEQAASNLRVTDAGTAERIEYMIRIVQDTDKKIDGLLRRIEQLEADVKDLRARPSRMWDGFILSVVSAGIGVLVALLLKR